MINIDLSVVVWGVAAVAVSAAVVRLILGVLAVRTSRKLLTAPTVLRCCAPSSTA